MIKTGYIKNSQIFSVAQNAIFKKHNFSPKAISTIIIQLSYAYKLKSYSPEILCKKF